ncbi:hypothetical protein [Elongatibacter sediminis]|uniref:Uncharacterized protein n=1 Tax=Elongatibacter sediminis TaxID=3119006 RepID=A0AAW9RCU4_9GAMM
MTAWTQRMVLAGLVLILLGFVFALVHSLSYGHQARLVAHDAYRPVFEEIAATGDETSWQETEAEITAVSVAQRRAADTHGHAVNMGILVILIGLLTPLFERARSGDGGAPRGAGIAFALFAGLYPVGLFLQYLRLTTAGEIVAAIGAVGAIACLAWLFLKLRKAVDGLDTP